MRYKIVSPRLVLGLTFFLCLLAGSPSDAQDRFKPVRSHPISVSTNFDVLPATGAIDIVAIRVEFQPDTNRFTTGNGTFEDGSLPFLESRPDFRIEPLPHDDNYFDAHLEFVRNYFETNSNNQLTVNYRLEPTIYRLDKEMAAYSPTGVEFNPVPIKNFLIDVWNEVEENGGLDLTGLDPDRTAFVIFHAGVGRDIELTGTLLDRTPQDIPSLSFNETALIDIIDEPGFNGFPLNNGSFLIKNSLIIPRTESRTGEDISGNEFVIPLSINGLLTASIGSFLGLPDLFNTNDGRPGIGRFGLMDGAGFFSYNGLFPPEPSAWERFRLGWIDPFEITPGTVSTFTLPIRSLDNANSIARVNITDDEFFLIENRHRDPDGTGVILTTRKPDGTEVQQTFTNLDEPFTFQEADFDTLLEGGVIVNVSNYDWSLPGGLDRGEDGEIGGDDDRNLNGGILIWHIDEAVIRSTIQDQRVNANPDRRGIDLEEADGAQDIGRPTSLLISNEEEFGTPFDFWWSGNNARVILQTGREEILYPGEFSPTSNPTNDSNSGAKSFFRIFDISDNLPVASFNIEEFIPENTLLTPVINESIGSGSFLTETNDYFDYFPLQLDVYESPTDTILIIPSQSGTYIKNLTQNDPVELFIGTQSQQPYTGSKLIIAGNPLVTPTVPTPVGAYSWDDVTNQFVQDWTASFSQNVGFLSSQSDDTLFADLTTEAVLISDGTEISTGSIPFQRSEIINGVFSMALGNEFSFSDQATLLPISSTNRFYTGIINSNTSTAYFAFEDNRFSLFKNGNTSTIFEEEKPEWPAITDNFEFFYINRTTNELQGFNENGAFLDGTPIFAPDGVTFAGTPLIADFDSDSDGNEFLILGQDSLNVNIYAFDREGNPIDGFPLLIGSSSSTNAQPIHPIIYNNRLYAVSHNGTLRSWSFNNLTNVEWASRYGDFNLNKVSARITTDDAGNQASFIILNDEETYNWPNPAQDQTNIRYEISEAGEVELTIITPSGRQILKQTIQSNGGAPEEYQLNTTGWQSGVYFAMVKATVNGKSESKLIKIAILK